MTARQAVEQYYDAWRSRRGDMSGVPLAADFRFVGPVASFDTAEGYREMARQAGQAVTRFEIRNGNSLRLNKTIALRGAYTFDAISPSGDRMYLVEYTSPRDPAQYLVRAYDVSSNHLLR